ncbi:tape measure protein [Pediococcus pentosaceus]|uniref:tape measure protein n=1 Tax=Pediococcus pentosaceus TaxID=1255 RepID=UPI002FBDA690
MKDEANNAKRDIKLIPREKTTKLTAKADTKGATELNKAVKSLPKEKQVTVNLNDRKAKEETNWFKKALNNITHGQNIDFNVKGNVHGALDRIKNQMHDVEKQSDKVGHSFRTVFAGSFMGNVASNAWMMITSKIHDAYEAGIEYTKQQQVMNATWTTLMNSAPRGADMVRSINNMSTAFGQSTDLVNELDQQFYHVLDKKAPTEQLTKSVLTMADTLGMSGEAVQRLGLNFTHMMSSSKMQLGDFNMISDQLPMFGERLLTYERKVQHNSNLTMADLRTQMSAGKISAKDAENVMNGLGQKYKNSVENMMGTLNGLQRSIHARVPALIKDFITPFLTAENPIYKSINKWMTDKSTDKLLTSWGKSMSGIIAGGLKVGSVAVDILGRTFGFLYNIVKQAIPIFKAFFDDSFNANGATKSLNSIKKGFDGIMDKLKPVSNALGGFLGMFVGGAWQLITSTIGGIAKGLSGIKSASNFDGLSVTIGKLTSIFANWFNSMKPVMHSLGEIVGVIAKDVWNDFGVILKPIGTAFDTIFGHSNGGGTFLQTVADALDHIAKNKIAMQAISWAIVAMLSTRMVSGGLSMTVGIIDKLVMGFASLTSFKGLLGKIFSISGAGKLTESIGKLKTLPNLIKKLKPKPLKIFAKWLGGNETKKASLAVRALNKVKGVGRLLADWVGQFAVKTGRRAISAFSKVAGFAKASAKWLGNKALRVGRIAVKGFGRVIGYARAGAKWIGKGVLKVALSSVKGIGRLASYAKIGAKWFGGKAVSLAIRAFRAVRTVTLSSLVPAMSALWDSIVAINAAIWASPITWIIAGIAAVGVAIYELYKHFKPFRNLVNGIGRTVGKVFGGIGRTVGRVAGKIWHVITGVFGKIGKWISDHNPFKGIGKWFGNLFGGGKTPTVKAPKVSIPKGAIAKGAHIRGTLTFSKVKWPKRPKWLSGNRIKVPPFKFSKIKWPKPPRWVTSRTYRIARLILPKTKIKWPKPPKWITSRTYRMARLVLPKTKIRWPKPPKWVTSRTYKMARLVLPKTNIKWPKLPRWMTKKTFKLPTIKWSTLTRGMSSVLRSMDRSVHRTVRSIRRELQNALKIKLNWASTIRKELNSMERSWNKFSSWFEKDWRSSWSGNEKYLDGKFNEMYSDERSWTSKTESQFSKFSSSFKRAFSSLGSSLKGTWKSIWSQIASLTDAGMHKTAGYINSGIKGIDYVLGKFGGSPSTISQVHFATGTGLVANGRLTRDTMAILNDGHDSPETGNRERIIHADGTSEEVQGINTPRYLQAGDGVLNATENKWFKNAMPKFAMGTGAFAGINGGLEKLLKVAEHVSGNIKGSFGQLYEPQPTIKGDVENAFAKGFVNENDKAGVPWWGEVWKLINDAMGAGGSSDLLKAVEKYGRGKPYVWGATGPDSFDCSGLVMYALKHAFDIDYPRVSGAQIRHAQHISKDQLKPGDLIGNDEHIGVYAGHGQYWSAMSPSSHPNIGMAPTSYFPGTPMYGRVKGIHGSSENDYTDVGKNAGLEGFVKRELGQPMFRWIEKHLAPLADDNAGGSIGNPGGTGVMRWKDTVAKALKANGFSASPFQISSWLKVIARESGGNPNIHQTVDDINMRNGNPAEGLVQTIPSTFRANAFAGHHNIMNGYDDLLAGIRYAKRTYGSGDSMFSRVASRGYANGGWSNPAWLNIFGEVPNEPEMAINPARDSADNQIMDVATVRAEKDPNGVMAKVMRAIDSASEIANIMQANLTPQTVADNASVANVDVDLSEVINHLENIENKNTKFILQMSSKKVGESVTQTQDFRDKVRDEFSGKIHINKSR